MKRTVQPQLSANGQQALAQYRQTLQQFEDILPGTIRNYLSDLRQFIALCEDCWWVQRFMVVDNSNFSPNGLTALVTLLILASQGRSPCFPF